MPETDNPRMVSEAVKAAEEALRPLLQAGQQTNAQMVGLGGEIHRLVTDMARDNASHFAASMGAIAAAKTPLEAAGLYSQFLASSMQRISRQFMDVTQAATRTPG